MANVSLVNGQIYEFTNTSNYISNRCITFNCFNTTVTNSVIVLNQCGATATIYDGTSTSGSSRGTIANGISKTITCNSGSLYIVKSGAFGLYDSVSGNNVSKSGSGSVSGLMNGASVVLNASAKTITFNTSSLATGVNVIITYYGNKGDVLSKQLTKSSTTSSITTYRNEIKATVSNAGSAVAMGSYNIANGSTQTISSPSTSYTLSGGETIQTVTLNVTEDLDSYCSVTLYTTPTGSSGEEPDDYTNSWGVSSSFSDDVTQHLNEYLVAEMTNNQSAGTMDFVFKFNNGWEYTTTVDPATTVYEEICTLEDYVQDDNTILLHIESTWNGSVTPPSDPTKYTVYFCNYSMNSDISIFLVNTNNNTYKYKGYAYNNEGNFTLNILTSEYSSYNAVAFVSGITTSPYTKSIETLVYRYPNESPGSYQSEITMAGSGAIINNSVEFYIDISDLISTNSTSSYPWKIDSLRVEDYSDFDITNETSDPITVYLYYDGEEMTSTTIDPGDFQCFDLSNNGDGDIDLYEVEFDTTVNVHNNFYYNDPDDAFIMTCIPGNYYYVYELRSASGVYCT